MDALWLISYGVLWAVVVIELFFLWALIRQIGILSIRLRKIDENQISTILERGMSVPNFEISDGVHQNRSSLHDQLRTTTILAFVSSKCSVCQQLIAGLDEYVQQLQNGQRLILMNVDRKDGFPIPLSESPNVLYAFPDEFGDLISRIHPLPWVMLVDHTKKIQAISTIHTWTEMANLRKGGHK
ncbi:MAG: redoxin domain-containing protein [Chloroflexi bacterium]|nr:redoxin domain-containing protein [Chloroflexota bacterium]